MSERPVVYDALLLQVGAQTKHPEGEKDVDRTGEIAWSERVRALLLAQPLNPLAKLEFKPL
jgi:hypothetical protein